MKVNTPDTNYWPKLAALGIHYGADIVLSQVINDGASTRDLIYKGQTFETAKEIFDSVTEGAES